MNNSNIKTIAIIGASSLLAAASAIFIGMNNYMMAAISFLVLFSTVLVSRPFLCIILLLISYMLGLQIRKWGLTTNIIFVAICFIGILAGSGKFKVQVEKRFFIFLCLFVSYAMFSYFWVHRETNFYDINLYLNNIAILLLMFLLNTEYKITLFYKAIVFSALILLASGIHQIIQYGGVPHGYMRGYYENHVVYALHMAWAVPVAYYLHRQTKSYFYLFACMLLIAGLLLAFSRGVLLAVLLAAVTYFLIRTSEKSKNRKILYASYILTGIVITGAVYGYLIDIGQYRTDLQLTTSGRTVLYQAAWNSFLEQPVTGIGWEKYRLHWANYANMPALHHGADFTEKPLNTHSSYLKVLSELGIIGLMLYLFFNFFLLKGNWKILLSKQGFPVFMILLIYYFHGFVDNQSYGNDRMFYFAAGILFSLKSIIKSGDETNPLYENNSSDRRIGSRRQGTADC